MKKLRRRIGRADSNRHSQNSPARVARRDAEGRRILSRSLRAEALEPRQLLAGDVDLSPHQNSWAAKDVNNDLRITPIDALVVLNELNRSGARDLSAEPVQPSRFIDVNGDNRISPLDALQVINSLNRGAGEDVPVVEMMIGLTDDEGNSLLEQGTRTANLSVDQIVNIEVLFTDARTFGRGLGLFTVYTDILASETGILEPLVTETQVLTLSENLIDSTSGNVLLSQVGSDVTGVIPLSALAESPAAAIRDSLLNDFGFDPEQIFTSLETREPRDAETNPVGDPFDITVRFLGDDFVDVDVPNFSLDASGLVTSNSQPVTTDFREIKPELPDGSINPVAVGFSLDTRSRTADGQNVYTNVRSGSFNDDSSDDVLDGFANIGATGQLDGNGLPSIVGSYSPSTPFEAFSIRARVTAPVENLNLSLQIPIEDENDPDNPNDDESVLVIYGNRQDGTSGDERGLSPSEYVLDADAALTINVSASITARADQIVTDEDEVGSINVLANDSNVGTAPLTIVSTSNGANGTTSFVGGVVSYAPNDDYFGGDQFTYLVRNGDGDTATGTVTVTVDSINDPPETTDFSTTVTEGNTRTLSNDAFVSRSSAGPANENQTPVLASVSDSQSTGSAVLNSDGSVTYTPAAGFLGTDTFTYVISDGIDTVTGTVTVSVLDVNDPPVANDDTIEATEDVQVTFSEQEFVDAVLANDTPGPQNEIDAGQVVTLQSIDATGSAGGTWVENSNGTYTYTPPQDVFGAAAETFTYVITDGELTDTATITINLAAVNDAPLARPDTLTVDELTTDNVLPVLDNDTAGPLEDATQTVRVAQIITQASNGVATVSADGTSVLYTPDADFVGEDTFTYTVSDGDLVSAPATVTVDVVPVIRPRARTDRFNVDEDSGSTPIDILQNDLPNEGFQVVLTDVTFEPNGFNLVVDGNDVSFTPDDDFFGEAVFTYRISDTSDPEIVDADQIAAATGTVTVTVDPVNDPPVFVADDARSTTEDTVLEISAAALLANDSTGADNEDDVLSISAVAATSARGGAVSLVNGTLVYQPAADYNSNIAAEDSFTYTISDGEGGTTTGTLTVTVTPVNDAPVLDLASITALEDVATVFASANILGDSLPGPATATDESGQSLTIVGVGNGESEMGGTVSVNAAGQVTYTSRQDFFGTDSFTVTVRDGGGAETTGTVTIEVENVNDPPEIDDPGVLAFSQSVATFTSEQLLANSNVGPGESDLPGQTLTLVNARSAASTVGSVSFNAATGEVTYTPEQGYEGEDQFEITVSDGSLTATRLITIDVREFEPTTISGSVFFDLVESAQNPVRDGVQSPHEPGLEMVQVRLVSGAQQNVTGQDINHVLITDREGKYEFTNVPPGQFRLVFDMPLMVHDGGDFAGNLGDADSLENQFTIDIAEPGGFTSRDYNFTVLGFSGRAANALDLFVSTYFRDRPDIAEDSNNGLLGARAVLDAEGRGQWFYSSDGLEDTRFGEINLDESGSVASLTVVMNDGSVLTGVIPTDRRVIINDGENGYVVQIFGSLESFNLRPDGAIDPNEFGLMNYQRAVDIMMGQSSSVI